MTVGVASAPHRLHPGVTRLAWAAPLRALLRPPIPSCCPLPPTTVPVLGLLPPRLLCPPLLLPLPPPCRAGGLPDAAQHRPEAGAGERVLGVCLVRRDVPAGLAVRGSLHHCLPGSRRPPACGQVGLGPFSLCIFSIQLGQLAPHACRACLGPAWAAHAHRPAWVPLPVCLFCFFWSLHCLGSWHHMRACMQANLGRFMRMAAEQKRKMGWGATLLLEPKPQVGADLGGGSSQAAGGR